jgi:ubiquinone biosynthesis protein
MVMERIRGVPVSDIATLKARGTDMQRLAEIGVEIFFTQVFKHNFFHADMHPGNIFVDVTDPKLPRYIAVDFGIIGSLSPEDQHYLAENFLAFFNRDYRRVAELHVQSGWVPAGTRVDQFEAAIRTVCEPIFNRPLKDISFGQLLVRLFQTARRFDMEVQPQLVLLQKTLLNIEGLGRELYPDLDLWQTAKPFLEQWTREQLGLTTTLRKIWAGLPVMRELLIEAPGQINTILKKLAAGQLQVDLRARQMEQLHDIQRRRNQHLYRAATGGALIVSGTLLLALHTSPAWLATVVGVSGGVTLLWGWLKV